MSSLIFESGKKSPGTRRPSAVKVSLLITMTPAPHFSKMNSWRHKIPNMLPDQMIRLTGVASTISTPTLTGRP